MSGASIFASVATQAGDFAETVLASPLQWVAFLGAGVGIALLIAGAITRTMLPLRWLAVGSNLGLAVYGALRPSTITLVLSVAVLPINLFHAIAVTRLAQRVSRAKISADMASLWLRPHMKARRYKAGTTLFSKGDVADRLYMLAQGQLELVGIGVMLLPGRIFGEIALFSPDKIRTQTIRCITNCVLLEIHDSTVRQLFYQNPSFAFHLMELLAQRLGSDIERARATAPMPPPKESEPGS